MIPNVGIRMKARGIDITSANKFIFITNLVSPTAGRNCPMLRHPKRENKLNTTHKARKGGANEYLLP